jgi:hypothetical protein
MTTAMTHLNAQIGQSVQKAWVELSHKSLRDIEEETAITWLGRAIASYLFYLQHGRLVCLLDAENYASESLEHAAMAGPHVYQAVLIHIEVARSYCPLS